MNKRRKLLIAMGAGAAAVPLRSFPQQKGKVWRIGFFFFGSRQSALETGRHRLFLDGMRELGYVEGRNFVIEARFADGKTAPLPDFAAELVRLKVDIIVANGTPVYHVLRQATQTIPIVITISADPVGEGFATSLARPGGNITGLSSANVELTPKHLELLMTAVPRLSRVAVLMNPAHSGHPARLKIIQAAAQKTGMQVLPVDGPTPDGIERAFGTMARERAGALIILGDSFFVQQIRQIAELALKHRLPSINVTRDFAEAGGLMSYGQNQIDNFRRAAAYVDKILKGAKPGDLPIEQPTAFELVINRKTAKAIGLTIPQELKLRADRMIE
jgi:putative ABC transport system substrate-binding protein